jgi:hypothetical protein
MILSASRNFIFIHIPKTGGLSIEAMLQEYDEKAKRNVWNRVARQIHKPLPMKDALFGRHDSVRLVEKLSSDCKLTKMSSLAVVRNPYDRAYSWFGWIKKAHTQRTQSGFFDQKEPAIQSGNNEDPLSKRQLEHAIKIRTLLNQHDERL